MAIYMDCTFDNAPLFQDKLTNRSCSPMSKLEVANRLCWPHSAKFCSGEGFPTFVLEAQQMNSASVSETDNCNLRQATRHSEALWQLVAPLGVELGLPSGFAGSSEKEETVMQNLYFFILNLLIKLHCCN